MLGAPVRHASHALHLLLLTACVTHTHTHTHTHTSVHIHAPLSLLSRSSSPQRRLPRCLPITSVPFASAPCAALCSSPAPTASAGGACWPTALRWHAGRHCRRLPPPSTSRARRGWRGSSWGPGGLGRYPRRPLRPSPRRMRQQGWPPTAAAAARPAAQRPWSACLLCGRAMPRMTSPAR